MLQARVRSMVTLRRKPHGSTVTPARACFCVVRAARVPRQSDQDWAIAAIIVIVLLDQKSSDLIVHLLVVVFGWLEDVGFDRSFVL